MGWVSWSVKRHYPVLPGHRQCVLGTPLLIILLPFEGGTHVVQERGRWSLEK